MSKKITPYFELNGTRYEIKKTRYLIAEYQKMSEESPLTDEDRANVIKAQNLVSDAQKYAEKAEEYWDRLCDDPTSENREKFLLFKDMSDKAIAAYNEFITTNNTLNVASKYTTDTLEKIAIKALAEQYFNMDEALGKKTWEAFVDTIENKNTVVEWLNAMNECLFATDDEEDNRGFLSEKRKMDRERMENRQKIFHRK